MNKLSLALGASLIALRLSAGDCPALSGQYTIGTTDADFSSINSAIEALKCGGVSGPVNFRLEDGTYKERVVLSGIQGADAFNKITFESQSGNNAAVIISHTGGDATVTLNGTSYVAFENLTIDHKSAIYGSALRVDGKTGHLNFKGVVFEGVEVTRANSNSAVVQFTNTAPKNDIAFEDCEINNGSIGIQKGGVGTDALDTKTSISGTLFFNQFEAGLALANEDAPQITNNVISSLSSYQEFKGMDLDNAANSIMISNNIVNAANGSYGVSLKNCAAQPTGLGQIYNNSVTVGGAQQAYGIYLAGNTDNQVLNFNRVKLAINGAQSSTQGYYKNGGSGNNVNLLNNIFYDLNSGGYTILGNTYKDMFNQLPGQSNPALSVSANGIMIEKVTPIK